MTETMTVTTDWHVSLRALHPCSDAREWATGFDSFAEAWQACERGDWMLWLIGRTVAAPKEKESAERKRLVLTACACARLALPYVRAGEERPRKAIEITERWARGEDGVTLQDVQNTASAASAAASAAYAAYAASAAYAAYAVAYAAYAAYAAASAAASAAYAASAASAASDTAYAAYAAASAAAYAAYAVASAAYAVASAASARVKMFKQCADIVRSQWQAEELPL